MSEEEKKPKVERMTSEDAELILEEWAEYCELDTERELFKVVVDELRYPVRLRKLDYDPETERFKLMLSDPMKNAKGEEKAFVTIQSTTFEQKKILQKFKDDESIDAACAMLAKYTDLTTASVLKLKDKDTSRINAIISGFITQVLPEKKR